MLHVTNSRGQRFDGPRKKRCCMALDFLLTCTELGFRMISLAGWVEGVGMLNGIH